MKIQILVIILLILRVDLHRHSDQYDNNSLYESENVLQNSKSNRNNKEYLHTLLNNIDGKSSPSFQREKKYSSRKKILDDADNRDEQEKPSRRIHASKSNNRSELSNRITATTASSQSYIDEASLCINEFDIKNEQLVKVKELKDGAHMIRFVHITEPSSSHGLDIKDICMLNCCVEEKCDLAMLSEQSTNEGYKCYLFACNGSCTYAAHQDYTSMVLKKDTSNNDEQPVPNKQSKETEKAPVASSSTLSNTCRSIEFSCRDGTCIPYYDVCNTYEDCPSGIDEALCTSEFTNHQRTQQENRKKPSVDVDSETTADIDETLDDVLDDDLLTTTVKSITKPSTKLSLSKSEKKEKNLTTSYFYNIDLDTQERVARIQKLKEYLEDTKGPEAWYHLFQTLVQHQQQDHRNLDPEPIGSTSSSNDDDNFKDHLLALEQQWIADRQKTTSIPTTSTVKPRIAYTKKTTTTTTKRMKIISDDDEDLRQRRPSPSAAVDDDIIDDDADDGDRYYWQPSYDNQRESQYNYRQKPKSTTTTRKPRTRYPVINEDSTTATILRANNIGSDNYSHSRSFLHESSVILLLLLGLLFTIILLVLVGFYCRDSWKRGRLLKNRSTDADYLINGLYL